jgi:hypothetical protein
MRTAAMPTFRKLYRKLLTNQSTFQTGLPKGDYVLNVEYSNLLFFYLSIFLILFYLLKSIQ